MDASGGLKHWPAELLCVPDKSGIAGYHVGMANGLEQRQVRKVVAVSVAGGWSNSQVCHELSSCLLLADADGLRGDERSGEVTVSDLQAIRQDVMNAELFRQWCKKRNG
ncbi:hypothetical protein D9M70_598480 [compost metagenome]